MLHSSRNGKKVLVIDDDFVLGEMLSQILTAHGYMVAVSPNGKEGLQRLHDTERPHLILLDLGLPHVDGYEFRRQQQSDPNFAAIPTVLLSAQTDLPHKAADLGAADYLQKPVETLRLLEAVQRHCP